MRAQLSLFPSPPFTLVASTIEYFPPHPFRFLSDPFPSLFIGMEIGPIFPRRVPETDWQCRRFTHALSRCRASARRHVGPRSYCLICSPSLSDVAFSRRHRSAPNSADMEFFRLMLCARIASIWCYACAHVFISPYRQHNSIIIIFICQRAITINRTNIENKIARWRAARNTKKCSSQLAAHNKLICTHTIIIQDN